MKAPHSPKCRCKICRAGDKLRAAPLSPDQPIKPDSITPAPDGAGGAGTISRPRRVFGRQRVAFGGSFVTVELTKAGLRVRPLHDRKPRLMPMQQVVAMALGYGWRDVGQQQPIQKP